MSDKWRWWVAVGGYGQGLTRAAGGPPTDLYGDTAADYLNNLEAECARLRAALEEIAEHAPVYLKSAIARQALEPTAAQA